MCLSPSKEPGCFREGIKPAVLPDEAAKRRKVLIIQMGYYGRARSSLPLQVLFKNRVIFSKLDSSRVCADKALPGRTRCTSKLLPSGTSRLPSSDVGSSSPYLVTRLQPHLQRHCERRCHSLVLSPQEPVLTLPGDGFTFGVSMFLGYRFLKSESRAKLV